MNDRELLELAAKAIGGRITQWGNETTLHDAGPYPLEWNPLEDDGDALRLACDLGLRVFPVARTESGAACSAVGAVTGERLSEVASMLSTRSATRLAIVRAAAAIAKATGEQP